MAYESFPFGDQSVTDEQFRRWARTFAGTAVHEGLGVSANSTGMNVQIAAGFATVQGLAFHNDATATITIDGNTASNPRIDTVVLRLTQGTSVVPAVVKGMPRANPVPPTLTQTDTGTFEFPLADVAVPAGAVSIAASQVTPRAHVTPQVSTVVKNLSPDVHQRVLIGTTVGSTNSIGNIPIGTYADLGFSSVQSVILTNGDTDIYSGAGANRPVFAAKTANNAVFAFAMWNNGGEAANQLMRVNWLIAGVTA